LLSATKIQNSNSLTLKKCYKHITLISLRNVTKVCDILENNEETDIFRIEFAFSNYPNKLYSFKAVASNSVNSPVSPQPPALLGNMSLTRSISRRLSITSLGSSISSFNDDSRLEAITEKKEYVKLLIDSVSKLNRVNNDVFTKRTVSYINFCFVSFFYFNRRRRLCVKSKTGHR
jgi:hypothetical protein